MTGPTLERPARSDSPQKRRRESGPTDVEEQQAAGVIYQRFADEIIERIKQDLPGAHHGTTQHPTSKEDTQ